MLKNNLPQPDPDTIILYCGPPPFEKMIDEKLKALGYKDDMLFKFWALSIYISQFKIYSS